MEKYPCNRFFYSLLFLYIFFLVLGYEYTKVKNHNAISLNSCLTRLRVSAITESLEKILEGHLYDTRC